MADLRIRDRAVNIDTGNTVGYNRTVIRVR